MARTLVAAAVLLSAVGFAAWRWADSPDGSDRPQNTARQKTLRLAVTDIEGMEALQREFGAFRDRLVERTGIPLEFFPVSDRTAAVEALANGQIDLVMTGPAEYVIFRSRSRVQPVIGFSRPNYFATISVKRDSGITRLDELRWKKVAMGDVGSTSKHLGPLYLLIQAGVKPGEFSTVHTSIRAGWEALLSGDVAAYATTSDKIDLLRKQTPDHETVVIAESAQLPMDVLLAAESVPADILAKIRDAFASDSEALIGAILRGQDNQKYAGMSFACDVGDSDYDLVREMFVAAGLDHLSTVHPGQVANK